MAKGDLYEWTTDIVTVLDTGPGDFEKSVAEQQTKIEQELLTRLVALNHERAAEEKRGLIRYLRPDYQNPTAAAPQSVQTTLAGTETADHSKTNIQNSTSRPPWPERLPEQVAIIRKLIGNNDHKVAAPDPEALSAHFGRKNKKRSEQIEGILETLKGLGQL